MKFIGCNPLIPSKPTIEIYSEGNVWDLHNAGVFIGFYFNAIDRYVKLNWKYYNNLSNESNIFNLTIQSSGVSSFEVKRRDLEMPYSEDDCLSELNYNSESNSIMLKFMGGQEIIIYSDELNFYSKDI